MWLKKVLDVEKNENLKSVLENLVESLVYPSMKIQGCEYDKKLHTNRKL